VEEKDDTTPSFVVTTMVMIWRVDVATRADVTVVFWVLLVGVSEVLGAALEGVETGPTDVDVEVRTVLDTTVVGVLLEVVTTVVGAVVFVVTVEVVALVTGVEVVAWVGVVAAAVPDAVPVAVLPVPTACLLRNMPSIMSMPSTAVVDATRAKRARAL